MNPEEVPQFAAMMEHAAEEAIANYRLEERAEEKKLARLMTKLDLLLFIPLTVTVIAVIVWLRLTIGPEVGTLTLPTGYAIVRAVIARKI